MISAVLNKAIAFILIFILLANNINTLTIVGDFIINQDFIAKTLCVQKSNQQGCNGKCYLMKELQKQSSETNTTIPVNETKRMALDVFCNFKIHYSENETFIFKSFKVDNYSNAKRLNSLYFDIDTPPPIIS